MSAQESKRPGDPQLRVVHGRTTPPSLTDILENDAPRKTLNGRIWRWPLLAVAVAAAAYAGWAYLGQGTRYVYTTAKMARGNLTVPVSATGTVQPGARETRLFVTPGFRFRTTDLLLTNFHLPRSTLFMLVCAFAGTARMQDAYAHAIASGFRFFSYGDACLLTCVEDVA